MQSKIVKKEVEQAIEYPCLMKNKDSGYIVLFTSHYKGVIVSESPLYYVGTYSQDLDISYFELFNGTIELSN